MEDDSLAYYMSDNSGTENTLYGEESIAQHGMVQALQNVNEKRAEYGGCKISACAVLGHGDYDLISTHLPDVPKDEVQDAIRWQIKDLLTDFIDQLVIDFYHHPISDITDKKKVIAVVVKKSFVNRLYKNCESLSLHVNTIDIPEFSYRNFLLKKKYDHQAVAFLIIKKNYGKVIIYDNEMLCFSRKFKLNDHSFQENKDDELVLELQRSLDHYERNMKFTLPTLVAVVGDFLIENSLFVKLENNFNQKILIDTPDEYSNKNTNDFYTDNMICTYGAFLRESQLLRR